MATFLSAVDPGTPTTPQEYYRQWGIDTALRAPGGLMPPAHTAPARRITLCQRSSGKPGADLGKTTGWIHRTELRRQGVQMLSGCRYERIDAHGLHLTVDGQAMVLEVDNVVICAGQVSRRELADELRAAGPEVHVIGGADMAAELDARRAVAQGTRLASRL